jgi:hypothetical protein
MMQTKETNMTHSTRCLSLIGDDINIREEKEGLGILIKNLVEDDFEID